ncbi:pyridoxal phosphate-dependent transferase [Phellopilus nigrolimitatus]|nr:pyridoxal phosphate-dependent transferase [Phellopilus nigrolimitatus]
MSPPAVDAEPASQRAEFILPTNRAVSGDKVAPDQLDAPCTYLCGNSLGALPKRAQALVEEELRVWATRAVEGHFDHPLGRSWKDITDHVNPLLAELVGAKDNEVACMGGLTNNLHLMMSTFYKPTATRYKILCEARAFPSDQYAFASQAELHGLDPASTVLTLSPRPGEYTLREDDILAALEREGSAIALVLFPGVQYYTGQWFPMAKITRAAKAKGCICGWDLAHAVGNVPLQLHDWGVDFAVWCSYKYLNAGPGAIAGLFIHEKWAESEKPRHAGWWGHDPATRFAMPPQFAPIRGAQGFQQSNPSVLSVAALLGSLQVFRAAGMMPALRARSVRLTARLADLLASSRWYVRPQDVQARYGARAGFSYDGEAGEDGEGPEGGGDRRAGFTIITPLDAEARGAQLSLLVLPPGRGVMQRVFDGLKRLGVVGDERRPDVIRLAPAPLYNTMEDCENAARALENVFEAL